MLNLRTRGMMVSASEDNMAKRMTDIPTTPEQDKEIGAWIQQQRVRLGLNRPEFTRLVLLNRPDARLSDIYLSKLEYGSRPLGSVAVSTREGIRMALRLSPEEWEAKTGLYAPATMSREIAQLRDRQAVNAEPVAIRLPEPSLKELTFKNKLRVPVFDMAAASPKGGEGTSVTHVEIDPAHWHTTSRAYSVVGDSMDDGTADAIRDGDVVLVNRADLDVREGKIYVVIAYGNGVLLKRAEHFGDQGIYLVSDNKKYLPIKPDEAEVIGRVYRHIPQERNL